MHDRELDYIEWVIEGRKCKSSADKQPILNAINGKDNFIYAKLDYSNTLVHSGRENHEEARSILYDILKVNNQLAFTHNILGVIFAKEKKLDEAKKEFEAAIRIDAEGASPILQYRHDLPFFWRI